eukprot:7856908-Pyramimonas_sp.AAC.1
MALQRTLECIVVTVVCPCLCACINDRFRSQGFTVQVLKCHSRKNENETEPATNHRRPIRAETSEIRAPDVPLALTNCPDMTVLTRRDPSGFRGDDTQTRVRGPT